MVSVKKFVQLLQTRYTGAGQYPFFNLFIVVGCFNFFVDVEITIVFIAPHDNGLQVLAWQIWVKFGNQI